MSKQGDIHRRWRMMLLIAIAALLGARYVVAVNWKHRKLAAYCGGPPAILHTSSLHKSAIETWDWRTNQNQILAEIETHPAAEGMLRAGDAIVWLAGGNLHVIDLNPPHTQRQWKTPFPFVQDGPNSFTLVGASANHRFAIVQYQQLAQQQNHTFTLDSMQLAVMDLETGEVVSQKDWHSRMTATFEADQFETTHIMGTSTDPNEPVQGKWRLTEVGDWELLTSATPVPTTASSYVTIAKGKDGRRRSLAAGETPGQGETTEFVFQGVQTDEHSVLRSEEDNEFLLAHKVTNEIQSLGHGYSGGGLVSFSDDKTHIIAADDNDDVRVFDAATGRVIASDTSGSFWRWSARGIAVAWLGAALSWFALSWRQKELAGAIIDLHAAGMTVQLALLGFVSTFSSSTPDWVAGMGAGAIPATTTAFGLGVGWYWIHGDASLGVRLRRGLLSIVAISMVPAATMLMYIPLSYFYAAPIPAFVGLFVASVTAMTLAPLSMIGWRVSDRPIEPRGRGFGLASMMLMTAGAAVVMGFLKLGIVPNFDDAATDVSIFLVPVFSIGILWPALGMLNIGRFWPIVLGSIVAVIIVVALVTRSWFRQWDFWQFDAVLAGFPAATAVLVLGMTLLCRKWGWRWRKASAPASELHPLEVAA